MTGGPRDLVVRGSLRADGPRGVFHVSGDGDEMEIRAPSLRSVRGLANLAPVRRLARFTERAGLDVRVVVRGHTIAEGGGRSDSGLRISWTGVLRSCAALLPWGSR